MNHHLHAFLLGAASLLPPLAQANEAASFANGVLLIPRVDSPERAGQYQSARFERLADGNWRLISVETVPSPRLQPVRIDQVEVVKTTSFPVAVYLRASGIQQLCGYDGLARVHQRTVGGRFEVAISVRHTDSATQELATYGTVPCTADIRPFKMTVPLPVYGLAGGTYAYAINGVVGSFTLDRENVLAGDCDAGEPVELRRCR
jgi:hypothetical protein